MKRSKGPHGRHLAKLYKKLEIQICNRSYFIFTYMFSQANTAIPFCTPGSFLSHAFKTSNNKTHKSHFATPSFLSLPHCSSRFRADAALFASPAAIRPLSVSAPRCNGCLAWIGALCGYRSLRTQLHCLSSSVDVSHLFTRSHYYVIMVIETNRIEIQLGKLHSSKKKETHLPGFRRLSILKWKIFLVIYYPGDNLRLHFNWGQIYLVKQKKRSGR